MIVIWTSKDSDDLRLTSSWKSYLRLRSCSKNRSSICVTLRDCVLDPFASAHLSWLHACRSCWQDSWICCLVVWSRVSPVSSYIGYYDCNTRIMSVFRLFSKATSSSAMGVLQVRVTATSVSPNIMWVLPCTWTYSERRDLFLIYVIFWLSAKSVFWKLTRPTEWRDSRGAG